jgi:hypothetical protein
MKNLRIQKVEQNKKSFSMKYTKVSNQKFVFFKLKRQYLFKGLKLCVEVSMKVIKVYFFQSILCIFQIKWLTEKFVIHIYFFVSNKKIENHKPGRFFLSWSPYASLSLLGIGIQILYAYLNKTYKSFSFSINSLVFFKSKA